jgi:dipeptidyl aminopeptidase/acylaminoacyl peptidase
MRRTWGSSRRRAECGKPSVTRKYFPGIDDLLSLRFLQGAELSPDLSRLAYTVSQIADGRERTSLYLYRLVSGHTEQVGSEEMSCLYLRWSPDGRTLALVVACEDSRQLFLFEPAGGLRQITSLPQGIDGWPAWSPNGASLAFTAGSAETRSDPSAPYRVTRAMYRFDGVGYAEDARQDIYTVDLRDGRVNRLTSDEFRVAGLQWSPDGSEILYTAGLSPDIHQQSHYAHPRLRVVNLLGRVKEIVGSEGEVLSATWIPRGNRIACIARMHERPPGSKSDLWVVERDGTGLVCRSEGWIPGFGDSLQTDMPLNWLSERRILIGDGGRSAFVQSLERGRETICRVRLDGPTVCEGILSGERSCFPLDLKGNLLVFGASSFDWPMELSLLDLDTGRERRVTHLNRQAWDRVPAPEVRHLEYAAPDGVMVEGWALVPRIRSGPPPPGVLFVHGGPHLGFGHIFSIDCQHLAASGYVVVLINQRGSRGYGDEFASAIVGRWGELDYGDLMLGMDNIVTRGWVNEGRLGCYGLSSGGYMVCWIVGQTDRFRAAVAENPITNFTSFYGVSDIGPSYATRELGGCPYEIPSIYAKCSPISYAHRCSTPTLLIQGEMDYRCPSEQAEQFYTTLRASGCIVEMLRFPLSPHNGSISGAVAVRRAQNQALVEWMQRHV